MRKWNLLLVLIILSLSILVSCREEQEVIHMGVNAEILEIYEDEKAFLVRGLDDNSILGDKSYVRTENAYYTELVDEKPIDIEFKDFSVGDCITVDVVYVSESYPTQTSTERVQLIERAMANYCRINEYMKQESIAAFSPYYELLDFQILNYEEKFVDGNIEATFFYKIIDKNYDKDPDTVGYIKEAKESGNKNYQQMYDEYLQPKESNFDLKVVIDKDDKITLYSNVSPKGIRWEETKMTDYILKD
ncbi:MAG: hypothetical protein RBR71_10465 [Gudongella sp.]|nr:hypothetical protein [Gudongella sp.]